MGCIRNGTFDQSTANQLVKFGVKPDQPFVDNELAKYHIVLSLKNDRADLRGRIRLRTLRMDELARSRLTPTCSSNYWKGPVSVFNCLLYQL